MLLSTITLAKKTDKYAFEKKKKMDFIWMSWFAKWEEEDGRGRKKTGRTGGGRIPDEKRNLGGIFFFFFFFAQNIGRIIRSRQRWYVRVCEDMWRGKGRVCVLGRGGMWAE